MPWYDVDGGVSCVSPGPRRLCMRSSLTFYLAVRELLPVWLLEDMRRMEACHWEEGSGRGRGRVSSYSPSEALLYALVHDHLLYCDHLLSRDPRAALAAPGESFCCCRASAPHLALAVRYNRVSVLRRILRTLRGFPLAERSRYLNRTGCSRVESGQTPVHLACQLGRPECLALLLAHGSRPDRPDCHGNTPLDTLLCRLSDSQQQQQQRRQQQQRQQQPGNRQPLNNNNFNHQPDNRQQQPDNQPSNGLNYRPQLNNNSLSQPPDNSPQLPACVGAEGGGGGGGETICLNNLLLFLPALSFRLQPVLRAEVTVWRGVLGDRTFEWLSGRCPPPLFVSAVQTLISSISPEHLPEALQELPVPQLLKPLGVKLCL